MTSKLTLRLPQADGQLLPYKLIAKPISPPNLTPSFNRQVFAAAHVVIDPVLSLDPFDATPVVDWDSTLAFRSYLYQLGFSVAEAMDTAQRGMGVPWSVARELIRRSIRHAKTIPGAKLACGVGTDQMHISDSTTLEDVIGAYREQLGVVEHEGGRVILMASRALARCARHADDYLHVYTTLLNDATQPVILHWLGSMFDPALAGYWGSTDIATAMETVLKIIESHPKKVAGIKISLLETKWEIALRRRLPTGVDMFTGDDFNYAELIAGDDFGYSHGLLGIFDPIAPVAALALSELAKSHSAQNVAQFHQLLDPTVALSREIFRTPTRHYKAGVIFLAWLNGHQTHFSMAAGAQASRDAVHYARVFQLADACGVLINPELAHRRMTQWLSVNCGI